MSVRAVNLMIAILAAPALVIGWARSVEAAPDRYGASVQAPPETADAAPTNYLNWPGKTAAARPAQIAAPIQAEPAAPLTLAGGPPQGQAFASAKIYENAPSHAVSRLRIRTSVSAPQVAGLLRPAEPINDAHPVRRQRVASRSHTGHAVRVIRVVQVVRAAPAAAIAGPSHAETQAPRSAAVQPDAAPAPAANPQPAAIAANGLPPRFYSVHRPFGVQPDPIPLPAQFFGDSAPTDLAAAPPPLPSRVILGQGASSTASVQRAVAAANLAAGDANSSN